MRRALDHARVLSVDIGPRPAGSEADGRTVEYVRTHLEHYGRPEVRRLALPQGGESSNVYVAPPGASGPYLLVGAHYDTVPRAPGANDNASGTGALLEVARAIRARPAALPVVFVAFGAEEQQSGQPRGTHHLGSRAYVAAMSDAERAGLVAMLNLDMIGFGTRLLCGRLSSGPREATSRLLRLGPGTSEQVTPDWSDNGPFLKAGLNAGWLWTGDEPFNHTPRDAFEHLQPEPLERAGRLALQFLRSYEAP